MKPTFIRLTLLSLSMPVFLFLASCGGGTTARSKDSADKAAQVDIKFDRKFNDYALYLAAMPLTAGNVIGNDDSLAAYTAHVKNFDQQWKAMDNDRLAKMRGWAKDELNKHIDPNKNLYYPFSGADYLHAYQFFPNAKKNLFIANEPVGAWPELKDMNSKQRLEYLAAVEDALGDIFKRSYFITGRMMREIAKVKGVIPIYMVFLARCNQEIMNIELIDLLPDGKTVVRTGPAKGVEGVRFTYRPKGSGNDVRSLEYFNCDATNDGMKKDPQVLTYVKAFGGANVFFKAASYLMHNPAFWDFKDATMVVADAVLQDDTGLPFRFMKNDYDYWLYGKYVKPISDFGRGGYQADLAKAYGDSTKTKPLPFSLGYHWKDNNQNYMLFVKKKK